MCECSCVTYFPNISLNIFSQHSFSSYVFIILSLYIIPTYLCVHTLHTGVCNFNAQLVMDLLSFCRIRPDVIQIELHPKNAQLGMVDFCQKQGRKKWLIFVFLWIYLIQTCMSVISNISSANVSVCLLYVGLFMSFIQRTYILTMVDCCQP